MIVSGTLVDVSFQEGAMTDFVRYTLKLPADVHHDLSELSAKRGVSILDMLLRMIRLGLWIANQTANNRDAELVLRIDDKETTVIPML
jgi:hypothetical protein